MNRRPPANVCPGVTAIPASPALTPRLAAVTARLLPALALVVSAYIHLNLASRYAPVATSVLSQQDLFLAQGAAAIAVALVLLAWPRRVVLLAAAGVGAASLAAILTYRYVNIGALGPIPNMYEPVWYAEKTLSAFADGFAALFAVLALVVGRFPRPVVASRS